MWVGACGTTLIPIDTQPLGIYHPPMQRFLIFLGILLIAAGVSCGGSDESPTTVIIESDDGTAHLEIPIGALPTGVAYSDITIKNITAESELNDPAESQVYDLQPHGLQFIEPVTISFERRTEIEIDGDIRIPVLHHRFEDTVEIIAETTYAFDFSRKQMNISADIDHFSNMLIDWDGFMTARLHLWVWRLDVGDEVDFVILIDPKTSVKGNHLYSRFIKKGSEYHVNPGKQRYLHSKDDGALSPDKVLIPSETKAYGERYEASVPFFCESVGKDKAFTKEGITVEYTVRAGTDSNFKGVPAWTEYPLTAFLYLNGTVTCELPDPTPTSAPTPTPTPTPTPAPTPTDTPTRRRTPTPTPTPGEPSLPTVVPDALPVIRPVYTIDGRPYDRVQFQYHDGHDGCTLPHVHSNGTVYPFQEWDIRGSPDAPLQKTGDAPLTDPDPGECGYGWDLPLKNPGSAVVPRQHFLDTCDRIDVDRIKPSEGVEARNLSGWIELCNRLRN